MIDLQTAIAAVSTAVGFTKDAVGARDANLVDKATADLTAKLFELSQTGLALYQSYMSLTQTNAAMQARIAELESQLSKFQYQAADLALYEPYHTEAGGFCLRAEGTSRGTKGPVYICATCAADGKKSYLQPADRFSLLCKEHGKVPVTRSAGGTYSIG
jgi:hypothetical protein